MGHRTSWSAVAVVVAITAGALAITAAPPASATPPGVLPVVPIAAASSRPAGTIVTVGGTPGWGPSAATTTSVFPSALARSGTTLFVADAYWRVIRAIDLTTGTQRVIAGTGGYGSTGDGGPATAATFTGVTTALTTDGSGGLYLAESLDPFGDLPLPPFAVRHIQADGVITRVGGISPQAVPTALVSEPDGALLLSDFTGTVQRVVNGTATTIAGLPFDISGPVLEGAPATTVPLGPVVGLVRSPDSQLYLTTPGTLYRIDAAGTIHTVAPIGGHLSAKSDGNLIVTTSDVAHLVTPAGAITTLAGCDCPQPGPLDDTPGSDGGRSVSDAIADAEDRVILASTGPQSTTATLLRRIEPDGSFSTIAGTGSSTGGIGGPAALAQFPVDDILAMADGTVLVLGDNELLRITRDGTVTMFVPREVLAPPEIRRSRRFASALAADRNGTAYAVVGAFIRRIDAAGHVTTIAGNGEIQPSGDGGPALAAGLGDVADIAVAAPGEIYISNGDHGTVRKVGPDGTIRTVAGTSREGLIEGPTTPQTGDGGPATAATLARPTGLAVDKSGNVFVIDGGWFSGMAQPGAVRKISPQGTITRVIAASTQAPIEAIALDAADNLLLATGPQLTLTSSLCACQVLRRLPAGPIEVLAGAAVRLGPSSTGDGGPATSATLRARSLTVDMSGNLFLVDDVNGHIREVTAIGAPVIATAPVAPPVVASAPFTG